MATSTLIQFLDAGQAGDTSHRRQVETFFAAGAIAAGDWVSLDVSQTGADKALYIVQTPGTAGDGRVVGVALDTATGTAAAPVQIRTVVAGYGASGGGATALPDVIGTALTLAAANLAEVFVHKRF